MLRAKTFCREVRSGINYLLPDEGPLLETSIFPSFIQVEREPMHLTYFGTGNQSGYKGTGPASLSCDDRTHKRAQIYLKSIRRKNKLYKKFLCHPTSNNEHKYKVYKIN